MDLAPDSAMAEVSATRYFSAHHMMISAAKSALPGAFAPHGAIVVIAMCTLAAEALANAIGTRIFSEWQDYDQLSPWGKYQLICRELKIPCSKGDGFGQRLNALLSFRSHIAHAKPQQLRTSAIMSVGQYKTGMWNLKDIFPPSKLEMALTNEKATAALATIEEVLHTVAKRLKGNDKDFILGDIAEQDLHIIHPSDDSPPQAHQIASPDTP